MVGDGLMAALIGNSSSADNVDIIIDTGTTVTDGTDDLCTIDRALRCRTNIFNTYYLRHTSINITTTTTITITITTITWTAVY